MNRILGILSLALGGFGTLAAQDSTQAGAAAPSRSVTEAVIAKTVLDRAPQDTGSVFPVDVGQLVCWTRVTGAADETIHHVWFHGDTQVGDVELHVGASPWRTWSRKTVPADWTGAWHVEIRDAGGTVLRRIDFTVGQYAAPGHPLPELVGGPRTRDATMAFIDSNHTRAALLIVLLGLGLLIALTPFATGLIGVPVLYVILQPVHDRLARHVRPGAAAVAVVILALFLVLVPGVSFTSLVITQAQQIAGGVIQSPLLARLSQLKIGGADVGPQLASLGQQVAAWVGSSAFSLVGTATRLAINLLVALFGLYFVMLQPGATWAAVRPYIPFSAANADLLRQRFRNVTVSTVIGTGLSAGIQGTLVGVACSLAGFPNATFWGLVATVLAVLPVVGSGLVWAPAAGVLLLDHRTGAALMMALWGLVVVGNVGYVIQPMVFRRYAQIHPLVTLVGALAGVPYFGILGLLIGPLALSYFFELLKMYREEYLDDARRAPS